MGGARSSVEAGRLSEIVRGETDDVLEVLRGRPCSPIRACGTICLAPSCSDGAIVGEVLWPPRGLQRKGQPRLVRKKTRALRS